MNVDYKPILNKRKIKNNMIEDNSNYLELTEFPELGNINMNLTTKFILENCNGDNTIKDISEILKNNFNIPANHDVEKDINQILLKFEDLEILSWKYKNPYEKNRRKIILNYEARILKNDDFENLKTNNFLTDPKDPNNKDISIDNLKRYSIYKIGYSSIIKYEEKEILFFNVGMKSTSQKSLYFNILNLNLKDNLSFDIIDNLIKWTISKFEENTSFEFSRLDYICYLEDKNKIIKDLDLLGFAYSNELKSLYLYKGQCKDVAYFFKDLIN